MLRSRVVALLLCVPLACIADDEPEDDLEDAGESSTAGTTVTTSGTSTTTEGGDTGTPPACYDALLLDLGLVQGIVTSGTAVNTAAGVDWVTAVDASAGGITNAPSNPWIYLRFTPTGLEVVPLDDIAALSSTDWDIAAKRFGVRLNSGSSGPSTVAGAVMHTATYAEITTLPPDLAYETEAFYTADCMLIDDGYGLGSPDYVLTAWWSYPGCVATTGVPFVLALPGDRYAKFVIEAYYGQGQAECNTSGTLGENSAHFTWRWSFLTP